MSIQPTLFEGSKRLVYDEAVNMTLQSMQAYGSAHDHWVFAFSGGKDSTATLTVIIHLIDAGRLEAPKSISVLYADTRMELPPLAIAAERLLDRLRLAAFTARLFAHQWISVFSSTCSAVGSRRQTTTHSVGVPVRSRWIP